MCVKKKIIFLCIHATSSEFDLKIKFIPRNHFLFLLISFVNLHLRIL